MRNALNLDIRSQRQLLHSYTRSRLDLVSPFSPHRPGRLTGNGFSNILTYPSFIGPKSFIVVMKTLTFTMFFRLDPAVSRIAERFLMAWIWKDQNRLSRGEHAVSHTVRSVIVPSTKDLVSGLIPILPEQ